MKILLAHNIYPILGGDGVFFHQTGRFLEENGHEVAYYCTKSDDKDKESPWEPYFGENIDYGSGSLLSSALKFPKMVYSKPNRERFRTLLKDFKPDLVHCFTIHTKITPSILDACREERVPVVISYNDYKHICPNYKLFRNGHICDDCKGHKFWHAVKNKCSRDSYVWSAAQAIESHVNYNMRDIYRKNVHTFLFSSQFMAKKTEEFWGKDNFRKDFLWNPFNSNDFRLEEEYDDYFLYFGRLVQEKGVDLLLKAMGQVSKDIKLKVVGNGAQQDELHKIAKELNLTNVEFLGPLWGDDLNEVLKKTRFTVVPSIWHENFPYVVMQSFAMGKPVLGSNRGGIPEMVQNGKFGHVFDIDDLNDFAEKIELMWNKPQDTKQMGTQAKSYADANYNDQVFYSSLMRIYNNVLS